MDELNDEILLYIFGLVLRGSRRRRILCRVCKRWKSILKMESLQDRTAIPFIEYYLISFPTKQRKKYLDDQRKCDKSLTKIKPRIIYEFMHSRNKLDNFIHDTMFHTVRGDLYPLLLNIDDVKQKCPVTYNQLKEIILEYSPNETRQIEFDINRRPRKSDSSSFEQFLVTHWDEISKSLANILKSYSIYNPEVGYNQGMDQIALHLLFFMSEQEAFWCLVRLLRDDIYLKGMFTNGIPTLHKLIFIYDKLLLKLYPKIHNLLNKLGINSTIYCTRWFMTIFIDVFPFDISTKILDIFIYDGCFVLFDVAMTIIKYSEKKLCGLDTLTDMSIFYSPQIESEILLNSIKKNKVNRNSIREIQQMYDKMCPP